MKAKVKKNNLTICPGSPASPGIPWPPLGPWTKKLGFTYGEIGFVKMTWKFTDWWSRWSCKSTWSWFSLQQYLKSAYLDPTENVTLFSSSHPVSWDHGSHAGLLIETWSHLRHQVSLTEWILNTRSMINNHFILWQIVDKTHPGGARMAWRSWLSRVSWNTRLSIYTWRSLKSLQSLGQKANLHGAHNSFS